MRLVGVCDTIKKIIHCRDAIHRVSIISNIHRVSGNLILLHIHLIQMPVNNIILNIFRNIV